MRLKKNIATSESGFIFNPSTGDSFSANPIAADILLHLKEGNSIAVVKNMILEKYDVEPAQVENDLDDFVLQLRDNSLTEV